MKKTIYLSILVLILASCSTPKELKCFSKNDIVFGSGGGFTNKSNIYSLSYDGIIHKTNEFSKESEKVGEISKKETKQLFIKFLESGLDTLEYAKPGNMYYFLGYENDSTNKKITWGGGDDAPSSAQELYNELIKLINK